MKKDEVLLELKQKYADYVVECEAALRITKARIENVEAAINHSNQNSPFNATRTRVKTFESMLRKCKEKGVKPTIDSIRENIHDIAGIRIITIFRDEIETIADILEHIDGINVIKKKDYVNNPKENGYQSLHLMAVLFF